MRALHVFYKQVHGVFVVFMYVERHCHSIVYMLWRACQENTYNLKMDNIAAYEFHSTLDE